MLHTDAALKDIPVEAVLGALGETLAVSGKVTAVVKEAEIVLSTGAAGSLSGQGDWELTDGFYKLPETSMAKLMKAKTMTYLIKKFPDLMEKGLPITHAGAHWQAKDGMILVNDGFVVSTDMKAGWVGKLDAARQGLDGFIRLDIREKNPQLARLVPHRYHTQPAFGHYKAPGRNGPYALFQSPKSPPPPNPSSAKPFTSSVVIPEGRHPGSISYS